MSIGMNAAFRAMQPKKKKCPRCGLYYNKKQAICSHCGDLDERGLNALLEQKAAHAKGHAALGKNFVVAAVVIGALLLLSFL